MKDKKTPKTLKSLKLLELKPTELKHVTGGSCDKCKYGSGTLSASN